MLPIFTDFSDFLGRYTASMLLFDMHADFFGRIRPPEESLHQKCRTFRAESDSSTLEVVGGLLVVVFEASRQTSESAA